MKRHKFGRRGFTLVELVFVIAIILVLAGIFLPLALSKLQEADQARVSGDLQALAASLTTFFTTRINGGIASPGLYPSRNIGMGLRRQVF